MYPWYNVECPKCNKKTMDIQLEAETINTSYYHALCHNCNYEWDFKVYTDEKGNHFENI